MIFSINGWIGSALLNDHIAESVASLSGLLCYKCRPAILMSGGRLWTSLQGPVWLWGFEGLCSHWLTPERISYWWHAKQGSELHGCCQDQGALGLHGSRCWVQQHSLTAQPSVTSLFLSINATWLLEELLPHPCIGFLKIPDSQVAEKSA